MLKCLVIALLLAAPAAAQEGSGAAPAGSTVPASVARSSVPAGVPLTGPELKKIRNSEIAALRKKQAAELSVLKAALKESSPREGRKAMKELRAAHAAQLAELKAGHAGKAEKISMPGGGPAGKKGKPSGKAVPAGNEENGPKGKTP